MSRIGNKPIPVPDNVKVSITPEFVRCEANGKTLTVVVPDGISLKQVDRNIIVSRRDDSRTQKSLHGLVRSLVNNAIIGVDQGYEKKLEIYGVGYKAQVEGNTLVMALGFSHPVNMEIPEGLTVSVTKNTVSIAGSDKQSVGEFAATVRSKKKPEPYKGKGIKYAGEIIRRKVGKTAKSGE